MKTKPSQDEVDISPEALEKWRRKNGYSYAQASRLVGADRNAWARWAKGTVVPSSEYRAKLASLLKTKYVLSNISPTTLDFINDMPISSDALSQIALLAFDSSEAQYSPFGLLTAKGPRLDSTHVKMLDILFGSSYMKERSGLNRASTFGQIQYLMGIAGYIVGLLQYADDSETDELNKAIGSVVTDLMGMRALLKQESPRNADDLWIRAFDKVVFGYSIAINEHLWPESKGDEEIVLACAIYDQEWLEFVTSELSADDFADSENSRIFGRIYHDFVENHLPLERIRKGLDPDTVKNLDGVLSDMGESSDQIGDVWVDIKVDHLKILSLLRRGQTYLMKLAGGYKRLSFNPDQIDLLKHLVSQIDSHEKSRRNKISSKKAQKPKES